MTTWALPAPKASLFEQLVHQLEQEKRNDLLQFMRGGFWRNFLVRYPEVNNQHKKMLRVHDRVYAAGATEEAGLIHLLKAQANDTYWHGLFGGIYMAHVRSAIYHHLIKAENAADRILHDQQPWQHYEFTDFDRDTYQELIVESNQQNLYISPTHGGTLFEWDLRRSAHNLLAVMTRQQESYHQTLTQYESHRRRQTASSLTKSNSNASSEPENPHHAIRTKEPDLDQYLVIDRQRRSSLVDHFLPPGLPLTSYAQERYEEQGTFIDYPYEARVEQESNGLTIALAAHGFVKRAGALSPIPVELSKSLFVPLEQEQLGIHYRIKNVGQARLQTRFGMEWNINLLGGGANPQAYSLPGKQAERQPFDSTGETHHIQELQIGNSWLAQDLHFALSQPGTLWQFSLDAITGSEAGFERTHQGSCITFIWELTLDAGESWDLDMQIQGEQCEH
jgi:alpha-amylase